MNDQLTEDELERISVSPGEVKRLEEPVVSELGLQVVDNAMFFNVAVFEHAQRVAKMFASSTMVPEHFRNNVGNCLIALNLSARLRIDPFMLMQTMYVVHGRPGVEGKLIIGLINGSGRFSPLKFRFEGEGKTARGIKRPEKVTAYAIEKNSDEVLEVSLDWLTVHAEGWDKDKGSQPSKWQTIPEMMFRYRTATFFARTYCPELLLGLRSRDELEDIIEMAPRENGMFQVQTTAAFEGGQPGGDKAEDSESPPLKVKETNSGPGTSALQDPAKPSWFKAKEKGFKKAYESMTEDRFNALDEDLQLHWKAKCSHFKLPWPKELPQPSLDEGEGLALPWEEENASSGQDKPLPDLAAMEARLEQECAAAYANEGTPAFLVKARKVWWQRFRSPTDPEGFNNELPDLSYARIRDWWNTRTDEEKNQITDALDDVRL